MLDGQADLVGMDSLRFKRLVDAGSIPVDSLLTIIRQNGNWQKEGSTFFVFASNERRLNVAFLLLLCPNFNVGTFERFTFYFAILNQRFTGRRSGGSCNVFTFYHMRRFFGK